MSASKINAGRTAAGIEVLKLRMEGHPSDPTLVTYLVTWPNGDSWEYDVPGYAARKAEWAYKKHRSKAKLAAALKRARTGERPRKEAGERVQAVEDDEDVIDLPEPLDEGEGSTMGGGWVSELVEELGGASAPQFESVPPPRTQPVPKWLKQYMALTGGEIIANSDPDSELYAEDLRTTQVAIEFENERGAREFSLAVSTEPYNADISPVEPEEVGIFGGPVMLVDFATTRAAREKGATMSYHIPQKQVSGGRQAAIAEADMDTGEYVGDGEDGVYINVGEGDDGWYWTPTVDSNTGSFTDSPFEDDGPYASEAEALEAGKSWAYDWCRDNEVDPGWEDIFPGWSDEPAETDDCPICKVFPAHQLRHASYRAAGVFDKPVKTYKVEWKPYRCTLCGHEQEISTNHYGNVYNHCKGCSWKSEGFGPGMRMPGGPILREFEYAGDEDPEKTPPGHGFGKGKIDARRVAAARHPNCPGDPDAPNYCGGTFECEACGDEVGWCFGADDDHPDFCDDCWARAHGIMIDEKLGGEDDCPICKVFPAHERRHGKNGRRAAAGDFETQLDIACAFLLANPAIGAGLADKTGQPDIAERFRNEEADEDDCDRVIYQLGPRGLEDLLSLWAQMNAPPHQARRKTAQVPTGPTQGDWAIYERHDGKYRTQRSAAPPGFLDDYDTIDEAVDEAVKAGALPGQIWFHPGDMNWRLLPAKPPYLTSGGKKQKIIDKLKDVEQNLDQLQKAYDEGQQAAPGSSGRDRYPDDKQMAEAFSLGNQDMWGFGFGGAPKQTRKVKEVDEKGNVIVARWFRQAMIKRLAATAPDIYDTDFYEVSVNNGDTEYVYVSAVPNAKVNQDLSDYLEGTPDDPSDPVKKIHGWTVEKVFDDSTPPMVWDTEKDVRRDLFREWDLDPDTGEVFNWGFLSPEEEQRVAELERELFPEEHTTEALRQKAILEAFREGFQDGRAGKNWWGAAAYPNDYELQKAHEKGWRAGKTGEMWANVQHLVPKAASYVTVTADDLIERMPVGIPLLSVTALKKIAAEAQSWKVVAQALRYKFGADMSYDLNVGGLLAVSGGLWPLTGPQLLDRDTVKITGATRTAPGSNEWVIHAEVVSAQDPSIEGQQVQFSMAQFNSPYLEVPQAEQERQWALEEKPPKPRSEWPTQRPAPAEEAEYESLIDMPGEVATPAELMEEEVAPGAEEFDPAKPWRLRQKPEWGIPSKTPAGPTEKTYVAPTAPGSAEVSPFEPTQITERPGAPAQPSVDTGEEPPPATEITRVDRPRG